MSGSDHTAAAVSNAAGHRRRLSRNGVTGEQQAPPNTLIGTAKLNGVDPKAWLTDTLCRIAEPKINRIDDWSWSSSCPGFVDRKTR